MTIEKFKQMIDLSHGGVFLSTKQAKELVECIEYLERALEKSIKHRLFNGE